VRTASLLLITTALSVIGMVGTASGAASAPGVPVAASTAAKTATGSGSAQPALTVLSQTSWVTVNHPFTLDLAVGAGVPPLTDLGITVDIYPCLITQSGFDQTVTSTSGPSGKPLSKTPSPVAWTSLAAVPNSAGVEVSIPVVATNTAPSANSSPLNGFAPSEYGCTGADGGVYPIRVQLVNTRSGAVLGALTTHLVYVTSATGATTKLDFAWELPLQTPIGPASTPPTPSSLAADPLNALAKPKASALAELADVMRDVISNPTTPVTVAATPQTLDTLSSNGYQTTVAALAKPVSPSVRQYLWTPYVPVDATSLVDSGLTGELTLQLQTGAAQLQTAGLKRTPLTPDVAGSTGAWITNDSIDDSTLAQLQTAGYNELVIPSSDVNSTPTPANANSTALQPFTINSAHGSSFTAMTSDSDLESRFTADPGDPVLAAHQLLAELALIYFELPNNAAPRGVIAVPPNSWSADPAFVQTLLQGLSQQGSVVQPVTVSTMFTTLQHESCRTGSCTLTPSSKSSNRLPVTAISTERNRWNSFAHAAPTAHTAISEVSELLLSGQAETLHPSEQSAVVNGTGTAIDALAGQVSVAGDKSITLTSRSGKVPVTIFSGASYPMIGTLTVTSDKLAFPGGASRYSQRVTIDPNNNVIYVNVQVRASGEFKMGITLSAPSGGLVLASGDLTVRSTATSAVGIALSLGAIVVLIAWWIRTSMRRRSQRHGGEGRSESDAETVADPHGLSPS
jgi:hypothetical protein